MKKLLLALSLLFTALNCLAAFIGFEPIKGMTYRTPTDKEPTQTVTYSTTGINVSYAISAVNLTSDDVFTTAYNASIPGFSNTNVEAQPAYPFKADRFELPEGCETVSVTITDFSYRDKAVILAPARILIADSQDYTFTATNIKRIAYANISSGNNVITYYKTIEKEGKKYVEVGLQPIQYNSTSGNMRVYHTFSYKVTYLDASGSPMQIIPIEEDANTQSLKFSYLIISKPEFSDVCEKFAKLKKELGFTTKVVLSDNWTPASIKETIQEHNSNPLDNLKFVLLVGSHSIVPSNTVNTTTQSESGSVSLSDYYYGCLDSDDDFEQDVYIGRIPANNVEEAEIVFNKIIKYERNPVADADFYNNSLHCAYYQIDSEPNLSSRYFVWTSEKIYDYLYDQGYDIARVYKKDSRATPTNYWNLVTGAVESIPQELRSASFNWSGNAQDIINNINRGVFYVLHRDHGSASGWGQPSFKISDIDNLANGDKLPIVFSLNCKTGDFSQPCFASKFLTKENGGCVGIFAASNLSYTPLNDYLALSMFNSVWRSPGLVNAFKNQHGFTRTKPVNSLAEILDEGMEYVCSKYGSDNMYYKVTRERFHIFGDPSMMIPTQQPVYYDNHDVQIQKTSLTSANVNIALNNENEDIYLAVSDNDEARIYFGKNIEYSGTAGQNTRFYIYGPNFKPLYIRTGIEMQKIEVDNRSFRLSLLRDNIIIKRENYTVQKSSTVNIYDTNMNVVKSIPWAADEDTLQIDVSTLEAGQYVVALVEDGIVTKSWNIKI